MRKYYNEARKMKYFESLVEIPVLEPVSVDVISNAIVTGAIFVYM